VGGWEWEGDKVVGEQMGWKYKSQDQISEAIFNMFG